MDWPLLIRGIIAIGGVTALGIYSTNTTARNAARFRERQRKDQQPPSQP